MAHFEVDRQIIERQIRNRLDEIYARVYHSRQPIASIERAVTGLRKGPEAIPETGWKAFKVGDRWGGLDQTTWFRLRLRIPKSMAGTQVVALVRAAIWSHMPDATGLTEGGESLAYVNGVPYQGLDQNRDEILLTPKAKGGERFEIVLEACPSTRFDLHHTFGYADLAVRDEVPWNFYWEAMTALEVSETLDRDTATRQRLLSLVDRCVKDIDLRSSEGASLSKALRRSQKNLQEGLEAFDAESGMGALVLAGHAHIDTAWLWPIRETQRKCSRTFSTVLRLMERYPEFHFSCSQPVQYVWIKKHFPELFRQIKKRIKEGRWELCGAAWVEPDHNVPSGESLIRQYLYGNRWFEREFGKRSEIAWVPDSFGYTWQLPQIMKMCGLRAFVTTKIDWSQYSEFPYSMFLWEGADGTRMPAVMPPLNYNGVPTPDQCVEQWSRFKQKDRVEELPFPIGYGDGGGGPTAGMIERGARMANRSGIPRCTFGPIEPCVLRMVEQADTETLPVYNDELYLELHRGCQTSQGRLKQANRSAESLLREAEWLGSLAMIHGGEYAADKLHSAWLKVLTNQFHDILPGSSIAEVYETAATEHAEVRLLIAEARKVAFLHLVDAIDTTGQGLAIIVFNSLSWVRDDIAEVHLKVPQGAFHIENARGEVVAHQQTGAKSLLIEADEIPPMGYAVYRLVKSDGVANCGDLSVSTKKLENAFLRIRFDSAGRLKSVYDKIEEREVIAEGAICNELQLFEDRPHLYDAWEIDANFEERIYPWDKGATIEVVEEGSVRAVVRVTRTRGRSVVTQDITMFARLPRVDFVTRVDWHEEHTLLKAAFPVNVRSSRATYDIQFGAIERPTHRNRLDDHARFEVTAHKWADLSEGDYGVSLLNNGRYGHDIHDNVIRLSLLRSSTDPDPQADQGLHEFTYSLHPHGGDWRTGTVQQGYELNHPLYAIQTKPTKGRLSPQSSFVDVDRENVIVETIKKHEDSDAVIVRVFEAYGQRGDVQLTFGSKPTKVYECDGMEENDVPISSKGHVVNFEVRPFQIRTFKVLF